MKLLFVENSFSWEILVVVAIVSFIVGMLGKSAIVFKQRKQILRLEDEMLSNHSRILALEKKVAEGRKDKNSLQPDFDISAHKSDRDLKAI